MDELFIVKLHNAAHDGYYRAKRRLVKGEQVVEVTAAELAQLEADPRITVISVSGVQPEAPDQGDGAQGDVVSDLVPGGVADEQPEQEPEAEPVVEPEPAQPAESEKPKKGGKR